MKNTFLKLLILLAFLICYSGCQSDDELIGETPEDVLIGTAYYGNFNSSEIFKIPIYNSGFIDSYEAIPTGANPYPVDQFDNGSILAITRGESSVTRYNPETGETKLIPLDHEPRSSAFNSENGLTLVSGKNKSMTSVIEGESVIATVGSNIEIGPLGDFGGGLATGHPKWVDASRFFHIDRANRKITVYNINGMEVTSLNTPTSVHHIETSDDDEYYYASCEGSPDNMIAPSVLKFSMTNDVLELVDEFTFPTGNVGAENMGAHHLDLSPNGTHIYVGSREGRLFVVDRNTMELVTEISVGKGAGHTGFSPSGDLAIVINHNDTFISVVNMNTFEVTQEITVADSAPIGSAKTIGHTFSFNSAGTRFYLSAPQDGKIVEVDLESSTVKSKLELGGDTNPLQGTYVFQ